MPGIASKYSEKSLLYHRFCTEGRLVTFLFTTLGDSKPSIFVPRSFLRGGTVYDLCSSRPLDHTYIHDYLPTACAHVLYVVTITETHVLCTYVVVERAAVESLITRRQGNVSS